MMEFKPENDDKIRELKRILTEDAHIRDKKVIVFTEYRSTAMYIYRELQKAGFMVEMDDFGKGYSSINMLTTLPLDALKLDIEFIKDIAENNRGKNLLGCILEMAKLLDLTVIAEGVENAKQYFLLKNAGCDMIQGYYFSKPLETKEFEKLLAVAN